MATTGTQTLTVSDWRKLRATTVEYAAFITALKGIKGPRPTEAQADRVRLLGLAAALSESEVSELWTLKKSVLNSDAVSRAARLPALKKQFDSLTAEIADLQSVLGRATCRDDVVAIEAKLETAKRKLKPLQTDLCQARMAKQLLVEATSAGVA